MGFSVNKEPAQATHEALQQARINLRQEQVNLALVFSSIEFASDVTLSAIENYLPDVPVLGASGAAVIFNQEILRHGLVIVLMSFSQDIYFNTACTKEIQAKGSLSAGQELGESLLYGFKGVRRDLSLIFSDGLIVNNQDLLNGLQERLGRSFPVVGASASDNKAFARTYVYFNQEALVDACCGILWGGKFNFGLGIKHGWKPLGKPRYVTRSSGNIVYEIDAQPAAKLYTDYLATDFPSLRKELNHISTLYPLGVYLDAEQDYLLRNILNIEDDGSLTLQGDIIQGSQIRLMIGTKESCINATRQAFYDVKNGLSGRKMSIMLVFNSISRYLLLGRQANKELASIRELVTDNIPMAGLYTYGEQAPLKAIDYQGRSYSHNQTIALLGIGE